MSYEYKEEILLDIGPEPNCNYESESNRYYDKIDELDRVYAQAAKADEYEVKAKAFDRIVEERNRIGKLMHNKEYPQVFTDEAFWNIDDIINDTESGGHK